MNEIIGFIGRNGYLVVFFGVLLEQIGIPLPSTMILIVAGALCGMGSLKLSLVLTLAFFAALAGDLVWFQIGRWRGYQVLGFLCRISLEPDSCVGGAKRLFFRHGAKSLLVAKFIPGFNTVAQPLAGAIHMPFPRFLAYEGVGIMLWAGVTLGLGFIFRNRLEQVFNYAHSFGRWFTAALILVFVAWAAWKVITRQRVMRSLRMSRITPVELKKMMDDGEEVMLVDLRGAMDYKANPTAIPNAILIASEELEDKQASLPRDRDIVLYCTCPNEATSARIALRLKRHGITRVRPLQGGLQGWSDLNYPLTEIESTASATGA